MNSQVLINEFSASNLNNFLDNYGKTEDWIELYNAEDTPLDIGGWYLSDKASKPGKWQIPQGTSIQANSYLLFWCSGRDEAKNGHFHTNFKLSQTTGKDLVILSDENQDLLQKFDLNISQAEHSWCRSSDGAVRWNICTQPTPGYSNNNSTQYFSYTSIPDMDIEGGFYDSTLLVTIINNELNSTIRYTLDGSLPTMNSPEYLEPISIEQTSIVKARSFSNDPMILPGMISFNTYFIDEDFTLPVFSVASELVIDLANGDGSLIPVGSLEYFNVNKERVATTYGSLNRHGQDSWVLPHRSLDWISRDEMGYSKEIAAELFDYSERDAYQRVMFRNSGDDNYPAIDDNSHKGSAHIRDEYVQTLAKEGGMKLDTRAVSRVILFLNGQYWGLYGMRERPVDHDYTEAYYGQDKYNLHFLTTWGSTEAEYGGLDAFNDWYEIRDFILENDMSLQENFEVVEEKIDLVSFVDYFIVNLNVVAKDWLNYNTAWWRGLDPEQDHTKWGYNLWDLDATFDYYINYTGIPNDNADAVPCDIDQISNYMDWFFGLGSGGIERPEECLTILNGSSPYPADDSIFIQVINEDNYCCNSGWDNICEELYGQFLNDSLLLDTCYSILDGSCPYSMDDPVFINTLQIKPECCTDNWSADCQVTYDELKNALGNEKVKGNVGKHEKLFLKLQEENDVFREFYYRRQADIMNTVFSCENMIGTFDSMLAIIEPEMPKQIERWGGSMMQWEENVEELRDFISERCSLLDEGLVECFDPIGPFMLTLMTEPEHMGQIDINTIEAPQLPWTANYFGGMKNWVGIRPDSDIDQNYKFSHWESKTSNCIIDDIMNSESTFELLNNDTLVAVFELSTNTDLLFEEMAFEVFPNPVRDNLLITYNKGSASTASFELINAQGIKIYDSGDVFQDKKETKQLYRIPIRELGIPAGVYFLKFLVPDKNYSRRIVVID